MGNGRCRDCVPEKEEHSKNRHGCSNPILDRNFKERLKDWNIGKEIVHLERWAIK